MSRRSLMSTTFGESVTINSSATIAGLLGISGASAGQIQFPASQNASSDANTLDDYEEGSWTPVIGGSGGQSGQSYTLQAGRYVKIGRFVSSLFSVELSTKGTITGTVEIQGLPFTVENIASTYIPCAALFGGLTTNQANLVISAKPNTTVARVTSSGTGASLVNTTDLTASALDNNAHFYGVLNYRATA